MVRQVDIKALVSHIVRGDGADKCRICMGDTTEGQVYLGDTVMVDEDKPVTLSELLQTITGVELNEEPMRPRGVCVSCATAVIAAQELRLLVMQSQKYWTDATKSLSEIPFKASVQVKSLFGFIDPDSLSLHIIENYKPMEPDNALVMLSNHSKRKPQVSERKQRVPRGNGPCCTCEDCNKVFPSPFYLDMHLKNSGHKEACLICGVMMVRGGPMKDHMYSEHGEKLIMCNECPLLFNNESELKFHKKNNHKPGDLTCNQCGRTFKRLTTFENHFQMHTVNICRTCGVQFTNRGCYREHRSKCEPNAKPDIQTVPRSKRSNIRDPATFTCDHCGKTYLSRSQLKNHILWIHMDVRPHQCSSCGKRFYTMSRLLEHTVVHTRVRNFECDICGVKLVSKMAAVYHRRRHTGEKPYKCEDCGETFISSSRRSEHSKRRHDKGVKIKCTQCPASFVRTHELKKHLVKAHSSGKQDVDGVPGRKKLKSSQT